EVVEPGTLGLQRIINAFGVDMLQPSGELDRKKLGAIVLGDAEKRHVLNSIVHPLVIESQDRWLGDCERQDPKGIAIVDAALMIESGGYKRFDKLIVVWCEAAIQLQRLMARNGLSEAEAKDRIASQMSQEEKKKFADHLIDTSGGFDETRRQVDILYAELRHQTSCGCRDRGHNYSSCPSPWRRPGYSPRVPRSNARSPSPFTPRR